MSLYQFKYELKVSFEDLDPMNVVWHGNYMRYMEKARCEMLEKLNYTYIDMKADGYAYPIAKMKVKYIKPARFGDNLILKLSLISVEPSLNIKYSMFNKKNGDKLFEAETMQIGIDIETGKSLYNPPKRFVQAINEVRNEKN